MKQQWKTWTAALLLLSIGLHAGAQQPQKAPWASDQGYWVVESNRNDPRNHIIRFYSNADELVYSETLKNIKLNPEKRSTKMKLKKALESFMAANRQNGPVTGGEYVVAMLK